jgi:hypothetical protein
MHRTYIYAAACAALVCAGGVALAQVPGSVDVVCHVDRAAFRTAAKAAADVTFTLWDAESGGTPCDSRTVSVDDLTVVRVKTDKFASRRPLKFAEVRAAIGSDVSPINPCAGDETWLDVTVASTTLTCAYGEASPTPPARKRLRSALFARVAPNQELPLLTISNGGNDSTISLTPTPLSGGTFAPVTVNGLQRVTVWFYANAMNSTPQRTVHFHLFRDAANLAFPLQHFQTDDVTSSAVDPWQTVSLFWSEVPAPGTYNYTMQWSAPDGGTARFTAFKGVLMVTPEP